MTENRTHVCVFFDDGELDPICACGRRAAYLPEQDGADSLLVLLEELALSA